MITPLAKSFPRIQPPHLSPLPLTGGEGRVRGNRRSLRAISVFQSATSLLVFPICLALFLLGCGKDLRTAQGVAEEFLDQHYVEINLQKAKEYSVGLALEKINDEIRLTSGQAIDASTRKPKVHYRLLEKKEAEGRVQFLYQGTIQAEDAPEFTRRWLIAARKDGDRWRVSNFTESD